MVVSGEGDGFIGTGSGNDVIVTGEVDDINAGNGGRDIYYYLTKWTWWDLSRVLSIGLLPP